MNITYNYRKHILLAGAALSLFGSAAFANSISLTTGVDTNNNIKTIGGVTEDTNWTFTQFYDSYNLTRADVFGASVSNPHGAIGYNISSAAASAASTQPTRITASVVPLANRPGWYNPGTGAQWLSLYPTQANGGIPLDPPGNYVYQLNLSPYIHANSGEVTLSFGAINADNHFALAIGGSVAAQEYLAQPFARQETWDTPGTPVTFSFSPADGTTLDLIIANNNDQITGTGAYNYSKNPTGFMVSNLTISQASGATPPRDTMTPTSQVNSSVPAGSGTVYSRSLVAAPEPAAWMVMGGFVLLALGSRFRKPLRS